MKNLILSALGLLTLSITAFGQTSPESLMPGTNASQNSIGLPKSYFAPHKPTPLAPSKWGVSADWSLEVFDSTIINTWNAGTNSWENVKQVFNYDSNFVHVSTYDYTLNPTSLQWEISSKMERVYNPDETEKEQVYYTWVGGTNQWKPTIKLAFTYNSNKLRTSYIQLSLDQTSGVWESVSKIEYNYDSDDNATETINYQWDMTNGVWQPTNKWLYTYDTNANLSQYTSYAWDVSNGSWVANQKVDFVYDSQNRHMETLQQNWDTTGSIWVNNVMYTLTYGMGNETESYTFAIWDNLNMIWKNSSRTEFDVNMNRTERLETNFNWDAGTGAWKKVRRFEGVYAQLTTDELVIPLNEFTGGEGFKELEFNYYSWNASTNAWEMNSEKLNYYSTHLKVGIDNKTAGLMKVYPNPAQNFVTIQLPQENGATTIKVYSVNGALVLQTVIDNQSRVDISQLQPGIYFMQMETAQGVQTTKLVKE